MKRFFHILVPLILLLAACGKKEVPVSTIGQPVFMFQGSIGADTVNYQAGVNHIYMFTGFFKDTQNLVTLKSYFAPDNCTNCEPYLSFEVKDIDASNSNFLVGKIEDIFTGSNTFNSFSLDSLLTTTTTETFTFYPENLQGTHYWDFGDGTNSTMANPTHVFSSGGLKAVKHVFGSVVLSDSITNTINTDFNSTCRPQFSYFLDSLTDQVSVFANQGFTSYLWNYGDGSIGIGQTDTSTYVNHGIFTITLDAQNSTCSTTSFKRKINVSSTSTFLDPSYGYATSINTVTSVIPRLNKSAFIVTYKNNGKEYRSYKNVKGINQSGNPVFTFKDFSFYDKNEHGEKTIKVRGTIDTYLYNYADYTDSIRITSNNVVVAAAYP
jgi:hypothetical protein